MSKTATMAGGSAYRLPLLLAAVCGLLGWFVWAQLGESEPGRSGSAEAKSVVAAAEVPDLPPPPDYQMPPLEEFSIVIERPIFSQSRRPTEVVAEKATREVVREKLKFTLKGIIITDGERRALLSPEDGGKDITLVEGDEIKGWTLGTVESSQVIFRRGAKETVLSLTFDAAPAFNPESDRRSKRSERRKRRQNRQLQEEQAELDDDAGEAQQ
ncbi:MAG: hypothetical protein AAF530_03285 [Pseudomonadota bacterium]